MIDYAISETKLPLYDVNICADCLYAIGTNSGYSLVPSVFGKRSALTNWSPLGIPNWYPQDKFIPKLVKDKNKKEFLSFHEMFSSIAGWSQFENDYKKLGIKLCDNTPDEILDIVCELHNEVVNGTTQEKTTLQSKFNDLFFNHDGYVGSQISQKFLERHETLL